MMSGTDGMTVVTAAVLIIGDEILSGRTQDTNMRDIARYLGVHGVDLCEARTVPDIMEEIIAALNALRERYDYVITTGALARPTTTSPPTPLRQPLASSWKSIRTYWP